MKTVATILLLLLAGVTVAPENPESNRITIHKDVNYLEELRVKGPGKIVITQGEHPSLELEGDKELLFDTKVKLAKGVLEITRKGELFQKPSEYFVCKLTVDNDFNKIIVEGGAEVHSELLKLEDVHVLVHDNSSVDLMLQGDDLLCQMFDRGKLTMRGKVDTQKILVEDQASYDGQNLVSRTASVKVVGAGNASVQADDSLTLYVVGSGTISYVKEPKQLSERVSGSGHILKK